MSVRPSTADVAQGNGLVSFVPNCRHDVSSSIRDLGLQIRGKVAEHGRRNRVARKRLQYVAKTFYCLTNCAPLQIVRSFPCHCTQLLVALAYPKFWIVAGTKRQQFIDHEFRLAALHLDPLQRSRQYLGVHLLVDAVADTDSRAKQLVDAFEAGGDINAVSQGGITEPG